MKTIDGEVLPCVNLSTAMPLLMSKSVRKILCLRFLRKFSGHVLLTSKTLSKVIVFSILMFGNQLTYGKLKEFELNSAKIFCVGCNLLLPSRECNFHQLLSLQIIIKFTHHSNIYYLPLWVCNYFGLLVVRRYNHTFTLS